MPFVVEKDFSYQCFIKREGNKDDLRVMRFKKNGRAMGKTASHAPPPFPARCPASQLALASLPLWNGLSTFPTRPPTHTHTEPRADGSRGVWTRCRLGGEPVQFGSDQLAQHLVRNSVGAVTRFGSQSRFGAGF